MTDAKTCTYTVHLDETDCPYASSGISGHNDKYTDLPFVPPYFSLNVRCRACNGFVYVHEDYLEFVYCDCARKS